MMKEEKMMRKAAEKEGDARKARRPKKRKAGPFGEPPKIARRPREPSMKQKEAHGATRIEYEEWCDHCVHGRGISSQHRIETGKKVDAETIGTTVSLDYCFMVSG